MPHYNRVYSHELNAEGTGCESDCYACRFLEDFTLLSDEFRKRGLGHLLMRQPLGDLIEGLRTAGESFTPDKLMIHKADIFWVLRRVAGKDPVL